MLNVYFLPGHKTAAHGNFLTSLCRIEIGENIEDNKRNLMMLTQKVFDAIVASSERWCWQLSLLIDTHSVAHGAI